MVEMRIEHKGAFRVCGKKIWISGQDNDLFGAFWDESRADGSIDTLRKRGAPGITGSTVFGVSRVENDPNNRAFFFYIVTQTEDEIEGCENFTIPECDWAIFKNRGELPMSLVNAEMQAFMKWLPESEYAHAAAPELEVYPDAEPDAVEFWLPIIKRVHE